MRKFRNSAIAIVSAAAISLGGMTAATAQDTELPDVNAEVGAELELEVDLDLNPDVDTDQDTNESEETPPGLIEMISSNGSTAWKWGQDLNADETGYGTDAFGSSRDDSGQPVPRWLRAWENVFDTLTVGSILGMVIFPIINFLKYNGIIQ